MLTGRDFVKTQPTQYGVQILKWCKRGSTIMCSIGLHPTGPPSRQPLLDRVGARHIFIRLTSIVQHIPNGWFDAYEVKVNKDIFQYQEKVKLISQFQRFILFFNGFLHSHKKIVKMI